MKFYEYYYVEYEVTGLDGDLAKTEWWLDYKTMHRKLSIGKAALHAKEISKKLDCRTRLVKVSHSEENVAQFDPTSDTWEFTIPR